MKQLGFAGRIADRLINSKMVPLIVIGTMAVGAYGLLVTPREDRPDIKVPTAVITIPFPGAGSEQVDNLVALPVSSWAAQVKEVVSVESVASADAALIQVEFKGGTSGVYAYGELKELMESNRLQLPKGIGNPQIQSVGDEVLTGLMINLFSESMSRYELGRLGEELAAELEKVPGVRAVDVLGNPSRQIQVLPNPKQLAAREIGFLQVVEAIQAASMRLPASPLRGEQTLQARVGAHPGSLDDVRRIQVGMGTAGVVYLEDVADVVDGPAPFESQSVHWQRNLATEVPSVTLALTSIPNHNISAITGQAVQRLDALKKTLIPSDVQVDIAYDAGQVATDNVMSVLTNFLTATIAVITIIFLGLGWRAALGVSVQIPSSLAIVPITYLWIGYTLNPVSIAATIVAIGLLADDNVIIMENIRRHYRSAGKRTKDLTVKAVDEVGNPTILAVFLIIATFLPISFISGEMGQYTRAIPVGVSIAIGFSLVIALTVTPYITYRLLRPPSPFEEKESADGDNSFEDDKARISDEKKIPTTWMAKVYGLMLKPFFKHTWLRWLLYGGLLLMLAGSFAMIYFRFVQLTLVPTLDRDIFVIQIELPPGSPMGETLAAGASVGRELRSFPEVKGYTMFVGTDGPMLMPASGPPQLNSATSHTGFMYVQLVPEKERDPKSFAITRDLVFSKLGSVLEPYRAKAWIRSIPSGPSSDNDIQAEITGPTPVARHELASQVARLLEEHHAAGAIERFPKAPGPQVRFQVDQIRASAHGVPPAQIALTLNIALSGRTAAEMNLTGERDPVPIVVRLKSDKRQVTSDIEGLAVTSKQGNQVPLLDVVNITREEWSQHRYRKNKLPIEYVAARVNRDLSQPLSVQRDVSERLKQDGTATEIRWFREAQNDSQTSLFWGGEWEITSQVYRDLSLAGMAVVLVIAVILAGWFSSYLIPLLIMVPIPLVFIGVIPAHWLMKIDMAGLGVLGVIALAGIVVRNALLLVDFTRKRLEQGMDLQDALICSGAVRTLPILLTTGTVLFGSGALIFEASLKPLGLTLISGVLISTPLTLILIPTIYFHLFNKPSTHPEKDQRNDNSNEAQRTLSV